MQARSVGPPTIYLLRGRKAEHPPALNAKWKWTLVSGFLRSVPLLTPLFPPLAGDEKSKRGTLWP